MGIQKFQNLNVRLKKEKQFFISSRLVYQSLKKDIKHFT